MIVPREIDDHLGLAARVGQVSADEFRRADGMFLTRTAAGLMPVATLDGEKSDVATWVQSQRRSARRTGSGTARPLRDAHLLPQAPSRCAHPCRDSCTE
jgi:hypothetical protein